MMMMRTNHLTTSTPKRRSARSRKPATKDDLSVGNLSDISIVSSVCSPIRDVETSSKTKSIIKTGHSSQDKNRKKKTVEFDLSSTDYDEPNDRSLSHDSSLNFRRPLGVRSGALNQHNLRRSNRKPAKDDFKLLEKPAKLLESGKRKRTSNKVNKTTNENRPNVKRTRNSNNLHQNGNQNEHDPVRQFTDMDDSLVTSLDEPEEDGLDLSFKSPPARTYAYHVHKRRSEIDQLIESEKPLFNEEEAEEKEETDLKMDTVSETHEQCLKADGKQKRATKVKLGTWDNAMKRNKKLEEFIIAFNREMSEIEAVPLSVVNGN